MNLKNKTKNNTLFAVIGSSFSDTAQQSRKGSIRKQNIATFYNVELSDKKSSRKVISQTSDEMATSLYSEYDL